MKRLMLIVLTGMLCAAASTVARAQETNRNSRPAPKKVLLPDLVVSSVAVGKGAGGIAQSVRVTVTNTCGVAAKESYVLAKFMDKSGAGGKTLYYIGNTVKALKGGESHSQDFDVSNKKMPADSHVSVEVDPYKKVKEDSEINNFQKLNPNVAPFPDNGATHCKPKD